MRSFEATHAVSAGFANDGVMVDEGSAGDTDGDGPPLAVPEVPNDPCLTACGCAKTATPVDVRRRSSCDDEAEEGVSGEAPDEGESAEEDEEEA